MARKRIKVTLKLFPCGRLVEIRTSDIEEVKPFQCFKDSKKHCKVVLKEGIHLRTTYSPDEVKGMISEVGGRVRGKNSEG